MCAGAQNRIHSVQALDRRTARARCALVAGCSDIAKIEAASPLQQIAADARHVTYLRRRAREQRLRDGRKTLSDARVMGHFRHACERTDVSAFISDFDAAQRQTVDVDQLRWTSHVLLQ